MTEPAACLTCYGRGEIASERGIAACPDCFGAGRAGAHLEWRLRDLERTYRDATSEVAADVAWLVAELRSARDALVRVLARCDDADDPLAREVKFIANTALRLYESR